MWTGSRYDPIDTAIPLILGGGVTTAQILPGSGNCMGGEGFIVKMRGSTVREAYVPNSPRLLKHALGENPKVRRGRGRDVVAPAAMHCGSRREATVRLSRAIVSVCVCAFGSGHPRLDAPASVRVRHRRCGGRAVVPLWHGGSPPLCVRCLLVPVRRSDGKTPMSRMGSAWLMRQKYEAARNLIQAQEQWCRNPQHRHDEEDEHEGVCVAACAGWWCGLGCAWWCLCGCAGTCGAGVLVPPPHPHFLASRVAPPPGARVHSFNVGADHTPFPTDLSLNGLVALLRGKARLHVHGYETQDLEMMMRLSREFNFNISAFHHALEAYMLPDQLLDAGVTIATFR